MLTGADNIGRGQAMKRGAQDYWSGCDRQYLELLPAVIQRVLREQRTLMKKTGGSELKDLYDRHSIFSKVRPLCIMPVTSTASTLCRLTPVESERYLGLRLEEYLGNASGGGLVSTLKEAIASSEPSALPS